MSGKPASASGIAGDKRHAFPALPRLTEEKRLKKARAAFERLQTRRSCRDFSDSPVAVGIIEYAIRAAGSAPSGANHQPWHFTAISSPEMKLKIREAAEGEERRFYGVDGNDPKASKEWLAAISPLGTDANKPYLEAAPWLIACFGQRMGGIEDDPGKQNYYVTESVGIACGILIATLHEAGLATLIHTPSPMNFLTEICRRPATERPMMLIVAGHPAKSATVPDHAMKKKSLDQISSWF